MDQYISTCDEDCGWTSGMQQSEGDASSAGAAHTEETGHATKVAMIPGVIDGII
jgi:hypothetical protein